VNPAADCHPGAYLAVRGASGEDPGAGRGPDVDAAADSHPGVDPGAEAELADQHGLDPDQGVARQEAF